MPRHFQTIYKFCYFFFLLFLSYLLLSPFIFFLPQLCILFISVSINLACLLLLGLAGFISNAMRYSLRSLPTRRMIKLICHSNSIYFLFNFCQALAITIIRQRHFKFISEVGLEWYLPKEHCICEVLWEQYSIKLDQEEYFLCQVF